ncbi:MAG: tripartite tricarboxylate transporter substrate binding protein [Betaproteobacteria bacterium]|nr:tripartite tricarboxylate transporter substrate binding protein [Betaproteobacteria bacterium]
MMPRLSRMPLVVLPIATALMIAPHAHGQSEAYPSRPLRMIIPFAPGGASDFAGRILQPKLAEVLGQQIVVDNRPGAAGNIGVEAAAKATPDGHTLLLGNVSAMGIGPGMFPKLRAGVLSEFTPISLVIDVPGALAIHGGLAPNNLKEFIAYAQQNAGKLNFGSAGAASAQGMAFAYFAHKAGIKLIEVPYKGGAGAATVATISGEVAATMVTTASVVPHASSGKLKILAVVSKERVKALPQTPTMIELGYPELDLGSWQGIYVPRATPRAVVDRLFKVVTQVVHDPWIGERYAKASAQQITSKSPEEFAVFTKEQNAFWSRIIKDLGIQTF